MPTKPFNAPEMRRIRRIHFVGIGGSGMSGIAEVLSTLGYNISGSDCSESAVVAHLRSVGCEVSIGHAAEKIQGADVVVQSSAIGDDNAEISAARAANIPVVQRAEMLAELMRYRYGIAVAGTHGKTTTTSLIAAIFAAGGCDPTFIVGGRVNSAGGGAQLGGSRYLVAEADESDASFLHLQPMVAVVTNIEPDHMETYGFDEQRLHRTFVEFLHNLPFYGLAVICGDDPVLNRLREQIGRPLLSYGFSQGVDYQISDLTLEGNRSRFKLHRPEPLATLDVELQLPGRHNALNAAAAVAVASDEQISDEAILAGLANFTGVGRRFEIHGNYPVAAGSAMLVDDYGHHPTELRATIDAARAGWPEKRIAMVFQPHRYSRTRDLYDDFVSVLEQVDLLVLLEVYSAGEEPLPGIGSRQLAASIRQRGRLDPMVVESFSSVPELLYGSLKDGDLLITQGAGSVSKLVALLAADIPATEVPRL
ncbi:MAG: UDP-N-acetylmuramate--L-alanine ligase [Porticoccaceae bacterium]